MLTMLIAGLLISQGKATPKVPPAQPLPAVIDAGPGSSAREVRTMSPAALETGVSAGRPPIQPLDSEGSTAEEAPPAEPSVMSGLELWALFNRPALHHRVRFRRYVYEPMHGVEKRAEGEVFWTGDSLRLDIRAPQTLPKPARNDALKDRNGDPYRVFAEVNHSYILRGPSVLIVIHDNKTFREHKDPTPALRERCFTAIAPFLEFGVADRTRTFAIAAGAQHDPLQRAHLRLEGLGAAWRQSYGYVDVLLEPKTGRPLAMKVVDSRARRMVYSYEEVRSGGPGEVWKGDPFRLDLKGYVDTARSQSP